MHTGTKSFISAEKEALIREHEAILRRRYPEQMHNNDVYVRDNPNAFIADNVRLNLIIKNEKKNILYILHEDIEQSEAIGGTQMHVVHLCQHFREDCNVFVANRVGNKLKVKLFSAEDEYVWYFPIGELHAYYRFFDEKLKDAWQTILNAFEIDLVHIHHLMGLSHDIIYVAKELGIPTVFTCHDYYMLTPSLTMLDKRGHIITREDKDTKDRWKGILEQRNAIYQGIDYLELWQKHCYEALKNVDRIIVPSFSVEERLLSYYPNLLDINVVEHGYELNQEDYEIDEYSFDLKFIISSIKNDYRGFLVTGRIATDTYHYTDIFLRLEDNNGNYRVIPVAKKTDFQCECLIPYTCTTQKSSCRLFVRVGEKYIASKNIEEIPNPMNSRMENHSLNIAFIGGINQDKGAEEVLELIKRYKKKVNWFIFGGIGEPELAAYSQKNCYKYGRYSSTDLPLLINSYDIDLICILSRCPETFSYTLSEAYEMGVPVIASNVGALKERIDFNGGGWLVDINDCVAGVSEILDRIISNRNVLDEKKNEIRLINLKNFRDMNEEYAAIYNKICPRNINRKAVDNLYVYTSYINNKYTEMGTDNKQLVNYNGRIVTEEQFKVINSLTFKLVSKIRKIRFPGKVILWQLMNRRV